MSNSLLLCLNFSLLGSYLVADPDLKCAAHGIQLRLQLVLDRGHLPVLPETLVARAARATLSQAFSYRAGY